MSQYRFSVTEHITNEALQHLEDVDNPTLGHILRAVRKSIPNMANNWMFILLENQTWGFHVVNTPPRTSIIEMVEALTVKNIASNIMEEFIASGRMGENE